LKKILIAGIGLIVLLLAGAFVSLNPSGMRGIELQGIDLTAIADGSYTGTFQRGRFTNTLTVDIENNRIARIDIERDVFAASVTNISAEVFRRVIEMQSTNIDAVAGATLTMKAYLKAIENALERRN